MEIIKKLNLNKTPQVVENGSIVLAKNMLVSQDGIYLENEKGTMPVYSTDSNWRIVGVIPCNTEIVVLEHNENSNISRIVRYNENTKRKITCDCNWKYSGGEIKGTFTYNVNDELIIAIAENHISKKIPLRTINLNTSTSRDNSDAYDISPNIPLCFMDYYGYDTTGKLQQGTYYFYIRYELVNNTYSKWFPCSIPIVVGKSVYKTIVSYISNSAAITSSGYINENGVTDISIKFNFVRNNITNFNKCQIGYIFQHENETIARIWKEEKLSSSNLIFNSNNYIEEISVDELTENTFNIFNVKSIANYNNRLYIADYEEDSPYSNSSILANIARNVNVRYSYGAGDLYTDETAQHYFINQSLIPDQVYAFFLHFIKADGSYTPGYRIVNPNPTKTIMIEGATYNVTSPISTINLSSDNPLKYVYDSLKNRFGSKKIYQVFNNYTHDQFGYFENAKGELLYKCPSNYQNGNRMFMPEFSNITCPEGYMGYFVSYQEVEETVSYFSNTIVNGANGSYFSSPRIVSTEAIIRGMGANGNIYRNCYYCYATGTIKNRGDSTPYPIVSISTTPPNDGASSNMGREAAFKVNLATTLNSGLPFTVNTVNGSLDDFAVCAISSIRDDIYISNTPLINLGKFEFSNPAVNQSNLIFSSDGYSTYHLDSYIAPEQTLIYDSRGILINADNVITNTSGSKFVGEPFRVIKYIKYNRLNGHLYNFKLSPEQVVTAEGTNIKTTNIIVQPANSAELFEYKQQFIPKEQKIYEIYDDTKKIITKFSKTIRRSDVLQTESFSNAWRNFRANNYKIISENKGKITNIVGIGLYLLVHTEHSLFMFNRDSSMKTKDKDIQLYIPDAFDVDYQEVFSSNKGYGGLQDSKAWLANEYGYTFFDSDAKVIYNFDNGQLNILSLDITNFINNLSNIINTSIGYDFKNNRFIICFKHYNTKYETLSYNYLTKSWVSLHNYYFNNSYNTKNNLYLKGNNEVNLYSYSNNYGRYWGLESDSNIFPNYILNTENIIRYNSYIDIIFNIEFNKIKCLEFLSYIINQIENYRNSTNNNNAVEYETSNNYSGYKLLIYSDNCNSGELDININGKLNEFNVYNKPFFDKGRWNLNDFRNYIDSNSDNNSLIYGKYIIFRFIINNSNDRKVILKDVDCQLSLY